VAAAPRQVVFAPMVSRCYSFRPLDRVAQPAARRVGVWRREIELQVGEVLRIGTLCVIVVELHDDEVVLKVCDELEVDEADGWTSPTPK